MTCCGLDGTMGNGRRELTDEFKRETREVVQPAGAVVTQVARKRVAPMVIQRLGRSEAGGSVSGERPVRSLLGEAAAW